MHSFLLLTMHCGAKQPTAARVIFHSCVADRCRPIGIIHPYSTATCAVSVPDEASYALERRKGRQNLPYHCRCWVVYLLTGRWRHDRDLGVGEDEDHMEREGASACLSLKPSWPLAPLAPAMAGLAGGRADSSGVGFQRSRYFCLMLPERTT